MTSNLYPNTINLIDQLLVVFAAHPDFFLFCQQEDNHADIGLD